MSFKDYVIFKLNSQSNFCTNVTQHFNATPSNIETATSLIIENILEAISFQCYQNNKAEEIYKIAKDCASLAPGELLSISQESAISKGRGVISEIFGVRLVDVVDAIAGVSNVKNSAVNTLTAFITPVALATLYQINIQNNYGPSEMCSYLQVQARSNAKEWPVTTFAGQKVQTAEIGISASYFKKYLPTH